MRFYYRMRQYTIPKHMNTKWHKTHQFGFGGYAVQKFLRLYREKLWNEKRRARKYVVIVSIYLFNTHFKVFTLIEKSYLFIFFQS